MIVFFVLLIIFIVFLPWFVWWIQRRTMSNKIALWVIEHYTEHYETHPLTQWVYEKDFFEIEYEYQVPTSWLFEELQHCPYWQASLMTFVVQHYHFSWNKIFLQQEEDYILYHWLHTASQLTRGDYTNLHVQRRFVKDENL